MSAGTDDPSWHAHVELPKSVASVRPAREFVRAWLTLVGPEDPTYRADLAVAVTELVTNAVVHAREPIELHLWRRDGGVRIGVSDGSRTAASLRPPDPESTSGRGLRVVDRLASEWGTEPTDDGKLTWADIPDPVGARKG